MSVQLVEDTFGELKDDKGQLKVVKRFTWTNTNKISASIITYGGYITAIKLPDKNGKIDDIIIGFDNLESYLTADNRYFGATVGRVANRIAKGKMTVEGVEYTLAKNNGENHLHGGIKGFDKVVWESYVKDNKVTLSYHSADMEEGYPGDVLVNVTFQLTEDDEFRIDYKATTSKPTPINMTNHSYFNLAGNGKGASALYKHVVNINADKITETNTGIPTGKLLNVGNTVFDLRIPKVLGDVINKVPNALGFDNNFCITRSSKNKGFQHRTFFVARVEHPESGRSMEVYSNQPGVQFYTSNAQPEGDTLKGKDGYIKKHGGFCLETQKFPDSVNHSNFPNTILHPGDNYHHVAIFKFSIEK